MYYIVEHVAYRMEKTFLLWEQVAAVRDNSVKFLRSKTYGYNLFTDDSCANL